ncbi:DUF2924 domain-containing protein [Hahella aquimaris]|uniref:DUF2924 domain-containing protein n=1 Tax=Hahella sp. HNIBRBA332 TaxID=3015983 RepID=UPI00273B6DF7|nr:DUF2924 domain-containing protein [Hahella sp. HNIBRBA332]WLQ13277.1 DUF2924 domain-containing protein [Hahella sp. HNIBRBA332]
MNPLEFKKTPSITAQVAALPNLSLQELRALWRELFDKEAPTHVKTYLVRRIAYRIQEVEFRKLNPELLDNNRRRISALAEATDQSRKPSVNRPPAGTVLTREFREVEYRVVVTVDGQFEFQGRLYPSLSMIAREITGTRWSGPSFFGLKSASKPKGVCKGGKR